MLLLTAKVTLAAALCLIHYSMTAPADFHSFLATGFSGANIVGGPVGYNGPKAVPVVLPDGHIADTPAVTAAKIAYYKAYALAKASQSYSSGSSFAGRSATVGDAGAYHGPQAVPVVLPSGHLADTSEVAAAKERHLSAVSSAASSSRFNDGSYKQGRGFHH